MALTATYDPVLARVRLSGDALGAGATQVYCWRSTDNFLSSEVLRGGFGAPMSGGVFTIDDYEFPAGVPVQYQMTSYNGALVQQASFTTALATFDLDVVWLKVLARPYLNQAVIVRDRGPIQRPARGALFDVVGRSFPVSVSDVRGSLRYTLQVLTHTADEYSKLDFLLASGEPVFVHSPSAWEHKVPPGYYVIGDSSADRTAARQTDRRLVDLPLTQVAAPGPDVVGATLTWQTVLDTYATWADVIAAHPTWADLLEMIADPSEVIVP